MDTQHESYEELTEDYTIQQVPYRGHSVAALKKYGVLLKVGADGTPFEVSYPYHRGKMTKYRNLLKKGFKVENFQGPGLFGWDCFSAGASKYCTITEGEEDALAAHEMLGGATVYSVQSSSSAVADIEAHPEIKNYERIYLDFDSDEKGTAAAARVAAMFPYNKIFFVTKTKYKDANEYLLNGAGKEYQYIWTNAKRYDPGNIISSFTDVKKYFNKAQKKAIASYPFKSLQQATYGIRTGETVLYKALEGIGKTEIIGAIENHVLRTAPDVNMGIIHLEEDIFRTCCRFVNYELMQPVHIDDLTDYSHDQIFDMYKNIVKDDTRINFFTKGKNDESPEAFLDAVRFMVASAGCKIVFFDHITRLATSFKTEDERKMLDHVATKLSEMAEELDFNLQMISHINDEGQTRGSRMISKEAHIVVNLYRDREHFDPVVRNTTSLIVEKNRPVSITGPIGDVYFDSNTFTLSDHQPMSLPPATLTA